MTPTCETDANTSGFLPSPTPAHPGQATLACFSASLSRSRASRLDSRATLSTGHAVACQLGSSAMTSVKPTAECVESVLIGPGPRLQCAADSEGNDALASNPHQRLLTRKGVHGEPIPDEPQAERSRWNGRRAHSQNRTTGDDIPCRSPP